MQNEPNSQNDKMNVNSFITKDYDNKHNWTLGENEPNTNPIQSQFQTRGTHLTDLQEGPAEAAFDHSCARFFLPTPPSPRTGYVYRKDYLYLPHRP